MTKDEIIAKLAEINPMDDDGFGWTSCIFCQCAEWEEHEENCIWRVAYEMTEKGEL